MNTKIIKGGGAFLILFIAFLFCYSIFSQAERNLEKEELRPNLQLSDFIVKDYEITEVYQRTIERKNVSKQKYIYFKVKEESFNFSIGYSMTDFNDSHQNQDYLLKYLQAGTHVKVLANKNDIEYASDNSILRSVSDFLTGTNKEVEVYKLTIENQIIFDQDIHTSSFANRSFADIAISRNLVILIVVSGLIYGLLYRLIAMLKKKKANKV